MHMGFVRKREVMKAKNHQWMQVKVFEMAGYDQKLDLHEQFEPLDYFSEEDLVPIHKPLPKVIQQWASERMPS
jgi:redox-sensitive bicupin YhaK (pirin superfamily)